MKIGLRLRGGAQSPVSLAHVVLDAERSGLEFVSVADDVRLRDHSLGFPSSFWPSLGAVAVATRRIQVQIDGISITGAMHPAAVAHLSLSAAAMLPGRFTVGFSAGSGRAVAGRASPARPVRLRALAEAIDVFRRLTAGERVDQHDTGVVINDLRLPGGSSVPVAVSLTATEETEASLAAELGCDLVVPLGADASAVVTAYLAAGGKGDVSAALLLADPTDARSIDVARALLVDRAALDDAREAGAPEPRPLSDDDVAARWIDATDQRRVFDAISQLSEFGVGRIELASPSRDAHLAIRQWRECNGEVDTAAETIDPVVVSLPPPPSNAPRAPFDVEADRTAAAAAVTAPVPPPPPADRSPVSLSPDPSNGDAEQLVDLVAEYRSADPAAPPDDGLRDALKVALAGLADDEADDVSPTPDSAAAPRLADRLKS